MGYLVGEGEMKVFLEDKDGKPYDLLTAFGEESDYEIRDVEIEGDWLIVTIDHKESFTFLKRFIPSRRVIYVEVFSEG